VPSQTRSWSLFSSLSFDVESRRVAWQRRLFAVEVGDVVGAAELERDDVVDLQRAPALLSRCSPLPR
jgi:hypothetical protein